MVTRKTKKEKEKIMLIDEQTIRALQISKKLKGEGSHAVLSLGKKSDLELKAMRAEMPQRSAAIMIKGPKKQVKKKKGRH